ncbi:hypothetical protein [Candidatus Nitrosocosmicus sp. T]
MSEFITDWESIVHKNVRSNDYMDAGNVDAVDNENITITSQGDRKEYRIPKNQVEGYNGAEVFLKFSINELERYKI